MQVDDKVKAFESLLKAIRQRCRVRFMRNILVHASRSGRRVVPAFIATAFAQDDAGRVQRARYMALKNHRPVGDNPAVSLSAFAS